MYPAKDRDRHGEQRQHKIVAQSLCKGVKPQNGRAFFLFHNIPVAFPVRILSKQKKRSRPHLKLLLARAVSRRYGHLFAHLTLCRVFSIGTEKRVAGERFPCPLVKYTAPGNTALRRLHDGTITLAWGRRKVNAFPHKLRGMWNDF
jgi:hypothetical protein